MKSRNAYAFIEVNIYGRIDTGQSLPHQLEYQLVIGQIYPCSLSESFH